MSKSPGWKYLTDIRYPRDAIVDSGVSVSAVGKLQTKETPHRLLSCRTSRILGMQEHRLPVVGKVQLAIRLGERVFDHKLYVMDDKSAGCRMSFWGTTLAKKLASLWILPTITCITRTCFYWCQLWMERINLLPMTYPERTISLWRWN